MPIFSGERGADAGFGRLLLSFTVAWPERDALTDQRLAAVRRWLDC